ncbi:MAG: hypothetical protein ACRDJC_24780, partial [Thermomicrobiales bacterium]
MTASGTENQRLSPSRTSSLAGEERARADGRFENEANDIDDPAFTHDAASVSPDRNGTEGSAPDSGRDVAVPASEGVFALDDLLEDFAEPPADALA